MGIKLFLRNFYPDTVDDSVGNQLLEYRIGLILLLSVSSAFCTLLYSDQGGNELRIYSGGLFIYFIVLVGAMKRFGKWRLIGLFSCCGWLLSNHIISSSLPMDSIGLNFFQSLIPSYILLATEDYRYSSMAALLISLVSMPYQYDAVYDSIISLEHDELKFFIISSLNHTKVLNRVHLLLTFGLTVWMDICKKQEVNLMASLKETAEKAKKGTESFFAAFSHEFRNPLNSLLGSLDLLKDDIQFTTSSSRNLFQIVLDCGEILFNMINNVIDASQINTQLLEPSNSCTEVRVLVHKIINISKANLVRKDLRLELNIDKRLPRTLMMDSGRFSQIFMNLISNAIKFTESGYIKIQVAWEADYSTVPENLKRSLPIIEYTHSKLGGNFLEILPNQYSSIFNEDRQSQLLDTKEVLCEYWHESKGKLILIVEDSGIGIDEEKIQDLFLPFHQADQSICKNYGGSGLGLWISKSLAKVLDGDIQVTSRVNKGSKFIVNVSCEVCVLTKDKVCVVKGERQKINQGCCGIRVLLVDDKQITVRGNSEMMQRMNAEVIVVNTTEEALKVFKEGKNGYFNIVFISFYLPSSFKTPLVSLLRNIEKESGYEKSVPIFMLVSETSKEQNLVIPHESNGYLVNPLRKKDVLSVFKTLEKNVKKLGGMKKILLVDDEQFVLEILVKMMEIENIPYVSSKSAKEAIEIYKEIREEIGVVLFDANLRNSSGFDMVKSIRDYESTKEIQKIPIVCISSFTVKGQPKVSEFLEIAITSNFYIVPKPVKKAELVNAIKPFL